MARQCPELSHPHEVPTINQDNEELLCGTRAAPRQPVIPLPQRTAFGRSEPRFIPALGFHWTKELTQVWPQISFLLWEMTQGIKAGISTKPQQNGQLHLSPLLGSVSDTLLGKVIQQLCDNRLRREMRDLKQTERGAVLAREGSNPTSIRARHASSQPVS